MTSDEFNEVNEMKWCGGEHHRLKIQTDLNRLRACMERPHHYWGPFAITSCSSAAETSGDRETSKKKKVLHVGKRWTWTRQKHFQCNTGKCSRGLQGLSWLHIVWLAALMSQMQNGNVYNHLLYKVIITWQLVLPTIKQTSQPVISIISVSFHCSLYLN